MKKHLLASLTLAATLMSGMAMAQTAATDPGHPRVNEVDQRLNNQQQRIDNGVAAGQINAKQEAHDQAVDSKVSQQMSVDEAKNGGHITKAEQKKMNKELNHDSNRIHKQRTKATTTTGTATTPVPAVTPAPAQ